MYSFVLLNRRRTYHTQGKKGKQNITLLHETAFIQQLLPSVSYVNRIKFTQTKVLEIVKTKNRTISCEVLCI